LKDFCRLVQDKENELQTSLEKVSITSKEALKAMDYRQLNMFFPNAKLYSEGGDNIDDQIDIMK